MTNRDYTRMMTCLPGATCTSQGKEHKMINNKERQANGLSLLIMIKFPRQQKLDTSGILP